MTIPNSCIEWISLLFEIVLCDLCVKNDTQFLTINVKSSNIAILI